MELFHPEPLKKLSLLLSSPRASIEEAFSPYFYRYLIRYKDPRRLQGYLELCQFIGKVTGAEDATVLDLGCGFGLMSAVLGLSGAKEVIAYDLNTEKIGLFKKLLGYLDPEIKNVKPVLGDSSRIEWPDGYFDVVIANETLSHVLEMEKSIGEVYRVLRPGGSFFVRDGNNSLCLLGRIRRRRFWKRLEEGPVDPSWFRSTDIPLPYCEIRRRMVLERFPEVDRKTADTLSRETAGLFGSEIDDAIHEFKMTGKIVKHPPWRYRNPTTGEFPEKEINPCLLKKTLEGMGFETSFAPYFYAKSWASAEMVAKRFFYFIARFFGTPHLFFVPGFALMGRKKT